MVMKMLTPEEVSRVCLTSLGLDEGALDVCSPEALAALVRLAASFLAPCSPRILTHLVSKCIQGLHPADDDVLPRIADAVDGLTSYGDLLEVAEETEVGSTLPLLHLAPPSFIRRQSGMIFLVGIAPDRVSPLPEGMLRRIRNVGHTRRLVPNDAENLAETLEGNGLLMLPESIWMRAPRRPMDPHAFAQDWAAKLERAVTSGDVAGLTVLDPERSPDFYKGRWVEPGRLAGRFVGRRQQRYGADLWCYVQLEDGRPVRLLDFISGEWRGCDQAWHLQMAIDALRGKRQRYRVEVDEGAPGHAVLTFFSPLPSWASRRLDILGDSVTPRRGLLTYRLHMDELAEERRFLETRLWLEIQTATLGDDTGR